MNVFAPKVTATAPARAPLPFGLFSVFQPQTSAERWAAGGINWEALTCAPAYGLPVDTDLASFVGADEEIFDTADGRAVEGEARPFTVHGFYEGTLAVGGDASAKAEEHLILQEQRRVEQALWTGDLWNTPYLEDDPDQLGEASPEEAVAELEHYLATEIGFQGVIHIPRRLASILAADGLIESKGGRMFTQLETPVVVGAGYTGNDMYVTPPLHGFRSEITTWDMPDTRRNNLIALAARDYVVGFDPCGHAKISVTTATDNGNGGAVSEVTIVGTNNPLPVEVQNTVDANITNSGFEVSGAVALAEGTQVEVTNESITVGGSVTLEGVSEVLVTNDPLIVEAAPDETE